MGSDLPLRNTLKTLCCANGWSYAIFWRFDPRNSLLLTAADAYYNQDQLEEDFHNMLAQVHLLGEGLVGQAAFTGNHRWMVSDAISQKWNLPGRIASQDLHDDDSELRQHFFSGIKTIAVVSVKPWGVVQFGSKHKILERLDFLEQTQRIFNGIEDVSMLDPSDNAASPVDGENYDLNELLSFFISSENSFDWNLNSLHGDGPGELIRDVYSSANHDDFLPPISKNHEEGMAPIHGDFSCFSDQLTAFSEAQVVLSYSTNTNVFLESNSSMDNVIVRNPCLGTLSGEVSSLSTLERQLVPETRTQDVVDMCSSVANTFDSSKLTVENPEEDSALTSLYSKNGLLGQRGTFQDNLRNSLDNQHSPQSTVATVEDIAETSSKLHDLSKPVDIREDLSKFCSLGDLCQWFDPSLEHSIYGTVTTLDNTLSQTIEFNPTYSSPVGSDVWSGIPVKSQAVHNSVTARVNTEGQQTFESLHISNSALVDSIKLDFSCVQAGERCGNILTPVVNAGTDSGLSECISELNNIGRLNRTRKGMFSELGIEDLLNGAANSNSLDRSNFEHRLSTNKRQRTDYSSAAVSCSGTRVNSMQPVSNFGKAIRLVQHKQEIFPKSQVGLSMIDDNHSVNNGRAVLPSKSQKPEQLTMTKGSRKSAKKPSRPQPKDRQQIQDRIKELRGIVPRGGKCSIDSLLDRTIKYMLFLQSITKYADKLQEGNEPKVKLIEQGNEVGDSKTGGGFTWALEVGGQTMVCPIIVEDMSSPGQMLIEMLCEEQGFFLEIAEIIRGFGLNILKGKMEIKESKIWARFIVEAKRHVTRVDVFWFLIQLVQQTNASGRDSDSANNPCNGIDAGIPSLGNYPRTEMPLGPLAMTMTETVLGR